MPYDFVFLEKFCLQNALSLQLLYIYTHFRKKIENTTLDSKFVWLEKTMESIATIYQKPVNLSTYSIK